MLLSKIAAVVSLGVLSFSIGCAAPASDEAQAQATESAIVTLHDEGAFKLYEGTDAPSPDCDVHTELTLSVDRLAGLRARLREVVTGTCRLYVSPDEREYRLAFDHTDCGSNVYTASEVVTGEKRAITITDHRTRTCRDVVPAIVVEESAANGDERTLHAL